MFTVSMKQVQLPPCECQTHLHLHSRFASNLTDDGLLFNFSYLYGLKQYLIQGRGWSHCEVLHCLVVIDHLQVESLCNVFLWPESLSASRKAESDFSFISPPTSSIMPSWEAHWHLEQKCRGHRQKSPTKRERSKRLLPLALCQVMPKRTQT